MLEQDLCQYINKYYGPQVLKQIGESSLDLLEQSEFVETLRKASNLIELYSLFYEKVNPNLIERNYDWKIISKSIDQIELQATPSYAALKALPQDHLACRALEIFRIGTLDALPRLLGEQMVKTTQTKAMSFGDESYTYLIEFISAPTDDSNTLH